MTKRNRWLVPPLVLLLCVTVAGGVIVWSQTRSVAPPLAATGEVQRVRTTGALPLGQSVRLQELEVTVVRQQMVAEPVQRLQIYIKACSRGGTASKLNSLAVVTSSGRVLYTSNTVDNSSDLRPQFFRETISKGQCREGWQPFTIDYGDRAAEVRVQDVKGARASWTLD